MPCLKVTFSGPKKQDVIFRNLEGVTFAHDGIWVMDSGKRRCIAIQNPDHSWLSEYCESNYSEVRIEAQE